MGAKEFLCQWGRGVGAEVLVYVSNFGILRCFLLVFFGGAIVVLDVVLFILLVTGVKQSQILLEGMVIMIARKEEWMH